MTLRVYIAGPITGMFVLNAPAFEAAADMLRAAGHEPVNPHTLHGGRLDLSHGEYMRTDLRALLDCDAIHMLPGWGRARARCSSTAWPSRSGWRSSARLARYASRLRRCRSRRARNEGR